MASLEEAKVASTSASQSKESMTFPVDTVVAAAAPPSKSKESLASPRGVIAASTSPSQSKESVTVEAETASKSQSQESIAALSQIKVASASPSQSKESMTAPSETIATARAGHATSKESLATTIDAATVALPSASKESMTAPTETIPAAPLELLTFPMVSTTAAVPSQSKESLSAPLETITVQSRSEESLTIRGATITQALPAGTESTQAPVEIMTPEAPLSGSKESLGVCEETVVAAEGPEELQESSNTLHEVGSVSTVCLDSAEAAGKSTISEIAKVMPAAESALPSASTSSWSFFAACCRPCVNDPGMVV